MVIQYDDYVYFAEYFPRFNKEIGAVIRMQKLCNLPKTTMAIGFIRSEVEQWLKDNGYWQITPNKWAKHKGE